MRRLSLALIPALLAVALAAPPAGAGAGDRAVEIFEPAHRRAEELLPVARVALAGQGEAMLDPGGNALVLVGPAAALASARSALETLDRPRRSVLVHWALRRLDALEASAGIVWRAQAGLRIGRVRVGGELPAARARALETTREGEQRGVLRILDGETGELASGRSVPVRSFAALGFVEGTSGLRASPRVLRDGTIELSLSVGEAQVERGGEVDFREASTRVRLRPGEPLVLGGLGAARHATEAGRTISAGGDEFVLWLTATLD